VSSDDPTASWEREFDAGNVRYIQHPKTDETVLGVPMVNVRNQNTLCDRVLLGRSCEQE